MPQMQFIVERFSDLSGFDGIALLIFEDKKVKGAKRSFALQFLKR